MLTILTYLTFDKDANNCENYPCRANSGCGPIVRRVAEADLRHISVSDHPTTDIRETCTYLPIGTYFTVFHVIYALLNTTGAGLEK